MSNCLKNNFISTFILQVIAPLEQCFLLAVVTAVIFANSIKNRVWRIFFNELYETSIREVNHFSDPKPVFPDC